MKVRAFVLAAALSACGPAPQPRQPPPAPVAPSVRLLPSLDSAPATEPPRVDNSAAPPAWTPPAAQDAGAARTFDFEDDVVTGAAYSAGTLTFHTGGTAPDALRASLRRQYGALGRCYEAQLAVDPAARGRVVLQLAFDGAGSVQTAAVQSIDQRIAAMAPCLLTALRSHRLPPHGSIPPTTLMVNLPLRFER